MVLLTPDPIYLGPGARDGSDQMDIRERVKLEDAMKKERRSLQSAGL